MRTVLARMAPLCLAGAVHAHEGQQHEPIALAPAPQSGSIFVACAEGGLVRLDGEAVAGAWRVGASLSDLVALDGGRFLAATDPEGGEVLLLDAVDVEVVGRRSLSRPTSVVHAGEALVVASEATRSLTLVPLAVAPGKARACELADAEPRSLELPFSARAMAWSDAWNLLVVADAFGGGLAVIDVEAWALVASTEIAAHNVRGMSITDDGRLLLAHQVLDPLAHTSFDDVHWGNLVRNVVREVRLDELVAGLERVTTPSRLVHLGEVGAGAGDPSSLTLHADGRCAVTLAGTDEVLLLDPERREQRRFGVGRRPVAAFSADGGRTYAVANSLDASISFVDTARGRVHTVALGPGATQQNDLAAEGRRLFFDARLSHDGWMSCHSCHSEGHSAGLLADTLGDESFGTPKRVLSLLGVGATAPYAWTGAQPTLEGQIEKTLRTTMHAEEFDETTVAALAAYLRTLSAPAVLASAASPDSVARGRARFQASGCTDCHVPPLFTSKDAFVVGIVDEDGRDDFNPPSLRGVGRRARLFHDGRYRELEELLAHAGHPGTESFDEREISDVAAYLRTL